MDETDGVTIQIETGCCSALIELIRHVCDLTIGRNSRNCETAGQDSERIPTCNCEGGHLHTVLQPNLQEGVEEISSVRL